MVAVLLAGCGEETGSTRATDESLTLTIVSEDWNGWDPEHRPTPETTTLDAVVGERAVVEALGDDDTELEVTDVRGDEVEITASSAMAPRGDSGGLDLNGTQDTFVVALGQRVEFATPTTDAGISYTLTLAPQE